MRFGTRFHDDQRVFKLPHVLCVHAEVGLQRLGQLHAFWDIQKCSARPHCAVQGGKFMVTRWNALHKILAHELRMLLKRVIHVEKDDTNIFPLLL